MTNIQIPSGLIDENIELFSVSGLIKATHAGQVKDLFDLPIAFIEKAKAKMNENQSTITALELAGFKSAKEKLNKYLECNFGGYDFVADFKDGAFSVSEYHECGFRGTCAMEGIVCGFFKINGHVITPFEIQIIQHLATEDTIPVMAEKLKVCVNTFETKKQKLYEKLGVLSRPRLVAIAYNFQILKLCS